MSACVIDIFNFPFAWKNATEKDIEIFFCYFSHAEIIGTETLADGTLEIETTIFVNVRHHHITAGKHSREFLIDFQLTQMYFEHRRGRGSYRGRGRGNFYRQDRGGSHQMQASHQMHPQGPHMQPYYNNQNTSSMQPTAGVGYHDANYHGMQANRYEMFMQFTTNFKRHVNHFAVNDKLKNHQQGGDTNASHLLKFKSMTSLTLIQITIKSSCATST